MDEKNGGGVPQFATAEYGANAQTLCKACGKSTAGTFYQVNSARVCAACAKQIAARFPPDSHAAFLRGLLFGIGGALLGLVLYVAFAIGTGLVIGFVSLAVGFIVGKAMVYGSAGVRGRRYQIAAVLLTYAAVSLSAVPIYMSQQKNRHDQAALTTDPAGPASKPTAKVIGSLILLGLASPFLDFADPVHGLIGLVILFVGMRIAWRLTGGTRAIIVGPFSDATAAA